jgi:hypothetical protein
MKKTAKNKANSNVEHKLDTVGVHSSILCGPTKLLDLDTSKSYVITGDFEVIRGVTWISGLPRLHLCLRPKRQKQCDFSVKSPCIHSA